MNSVSDSRRKVEGLIQFQERMVTTRLMIIMIIINSVALVRERTIPTEQPPPVGEVSANFCG